MHGFAYGESVDASIAASTHITFNDPVHGFACGEFVDAESS